MKNEDIKIEDMNIKQLLIRLRKVRVEYNSIMDLVFRSSKQETDPLKKLDILDRGDTFIENYKIKSKIINERIELIETKANIYICKILHKKKNEHRLLKENFLRSNQDDLTMKQLRKAIYQLERIRL